MQQITDLQQILGKTITLATEEGNNIIVLGFGDGDYMQLVPEYDYMREYTSIDYMQELYPDSYHISDETIIALGLKTAEQIQAERDASAKAQQEQYLEGEKRLLKNLLSKYPDIAADYMQQQPA